MRAVSLRLLLAVAAISSSPLAYADDLDPGVASDLNLDLVLSNLSAPTGGDFLPDGRMLITEQFSGRILLWDGANPPTTVGTVPVETGNERGLLGLAVDPEFTTSRRIYFYYSTGGSQAAGYALMDAGTDVIDTANITNVLTNMGENRNHNGGAIAFGPDNHLYIGVGDSGCNCGCAPGTNTSNFRSTCLTGLMGKVLRIDRDGGIPSDNPLVNETAVAACGRNAGCRGAGTPPTETGAPRTEIYNWGFRNPWRFAFDDQTGHLWIGDVGEVTYEEITISTGPGQHHGWPYREGDEGQPATRCNEITPQSGNCKAPAVVYPRAEQPQSRSASVTGGVFSNHCSWPVAWRGVYWFGDYAKARVWSVTPNAARDGVDGGRTVIVTGAQGPVHFMQGPNGAVFYLDVNTGTLWRITPAQPEPCDDMDAGPGPDADVDAGPAPDSGDAPDSGPAVDTGVAEPDTGVAEPDTGVVTADAGVSPVDAGETGEPLDNDGCRCVEAEQPATGWAGLAAVFGLLLITRRRR